MSVISILGGDWEILLDDEKNQNGGSTAIAGMRTVQAAVASPTIVTTRTPENRTTHLLRVHLANTRIAMRNVRKAAID